jgi:hypothetical protein
MVIGLSYSEELNYSDEFYRYCRIWLNLYLIYYSMAGHQRTADTPADGGRADTPAGGGQADTGGGRYTTVGIHAYAMGEGGIRREPQRGGRERCINMCEISSASTALVISRAF